MKNTLHSLDDMLALADNGGYLPELQSRIEALVRDMRDFGHAYGSGAKGKISLTIDLKLDRFGQIEMTVEDKITTPKAPKAKALAWSTEDGTLTPNNPAQTRMDVRDTPGGGRELRAVTGD